MKIFKVNLTKQQAQLLKSATAKIYNKFPLAFRVMPIVDKEPGIIVMKDEIREIFFACEVKDVCKNTKGPVASIFWQGLHKYEDGLDIVEKSIVAYGGVLMGRLEKGLTWISLFIALAPMLGFMGTVIGMIGAFSDIAAAGTISATVVAGGIQVALITTVFGLIVAAILQIFYNYIVAKIDSIVNDMEDSTIEFVDILSNYKLNK